MNTTTNKDANKKKKIIAASIAGVFALLGATYYVMSGDEDIQATPVNAVAADSNTGNPVQSTDPNYIGEVEKANKLAEQKAIESGTGSISVISNKLEEEQVDENQFLGKAASDVQSQNIANSNPNEQNSLEAENAQLRMQLAQAQQSGQPQIQIHEKIIYQEVAVPMEEAYDYKKDTGLIALFNAAEAPQSFALTSVSNRALREQIAKEKAAEQKEMQQQMKGNESNSVNQNSSLVTVNKVGDLVPATLQTGIDSRNPSIIRVRIESGPLSGAVLTGSWEQSNESVGVTLNMMNLPNAEKSIPINAVLLDYKTASSALASSVNRHLPERTLAAFASTFFKSFAASMSNNNLTGQTTIATSTGSTVSTSSSTPKTNKEMVKEAGAEAIGTATDQLMALVPQKPTVKVKSNMEVAVYFTEDLQLDKKLLNDY